MDVCNGRTRRTFWLFAAFLRFLLAFAAIARETAVVVLPQRPPARITCVARMAVDVCARHYVCSAAGCGRWVSPSVMAFCDGFGRLICPACARKAAVCGYRRPSKPSVMAVDFCSARKADSDEDFRGARSISCARARPTVKGPACGGNQNRTLQRIIEEATPQAEFPMTIAEYWKPMPHPTDWRPPPYNPPASIRIPTPETAVAAVWTVIGEDAFNHSAGRASSSSVPLPSPQPMLSLPSPAEADLSHVVVICLTRFCCSPDVRARLVFASALAPCRARMAAAQAPLSPTWSSGAWILTPISRAAFTSIMEARARGLVSRERSMTLRRFIVAETGDVPRVKAALQVIPRRRRPKLRVQPLR